MAEYSRLAKGSYTVTTGTLGVSAPAAKIINLPFRPDYVEVTNLTQAATPAQHGIPFASWDANSTPVTISSVQYDTIAQVFNATPVLTTDSVRVGGGISTFYGGLALQYGAAQGLTSITKSGSGGPTTVVSAAVHGLTSGDVIIFSNLYQTATTGMPQIAGIPFTVTVTNTTTFTIPWDTSTSNYATYTQSTATNANGAFKKVLYPFLYAPGVNIISGITLGTTTTIDTTSAHNFVVGQEVAFHIPTVPSSATQWGTTGLNTLPNVIIPGSPIYAYVIAVTDYNTFVVNVNSSAYTAFSANVPVAAVPGLEYPQVVAVGDVNTGGVQISAGSAFYPPPFIRPIGNVTVNSIGGPAIQGAFFNNTSMGFIIGNSPSRTDTSSWVGGSSGDIITWRAYLHDLTLP